MHFQLPSGGGEKCGVQAVAEAIRLDPQGADCLRFSTMQAPRSTIPPAVAILALVTVGSAPGQVPPPPGPVNLMPRQGVLVLTGDRLLEGQVSRAGDLYYVTLPYGEIRVRANEVLMVCASREDAYRRKRAAIRAGSVQDHVELAEWCLRHEMLEAASRELADAAAADPSHPMIPLLARRLEVARQPLPAAPVVQGAAGPAAQGGVDGPSVEDLEAVVRAMPPGTLGEFSDTIQPMLLDRCASGACHGPRAASRLRFWRPPPGKPLSKRMTQHNLYAAMQYVDRSRPEASPLLRVPTAPHATAEQAIFLERDAEKYARLVAWVQRLDLAAPQPVLEPTVSPAPTGMGRPAPAAGTPLAPPARDVRSVTLPREAGPASPFDVPPTPLESMRPSPSPVKRGAPPAFVPADPFDPEIFNRRYAPSDGPSP